MITYTNKDFKSVLNVRKFIDNWFWDKYGINPYNGCSFGCIYCDSRSSKYHLPEDFENNIIVKNNIGPMLDSRLKNARTLLPDVTGIGGTTDAYQPAETKFFNTRTCLEILEKYGYPVHVVTKSRLVLRDLDIIEKIATNNWCTVSTTITTINPDKARFLERRVALPEKRLELIKEIKKKSISIQCGVFMMPVVPYITDDEKEMERLIATASDNGADFVLFGSGMTMRDMQALWFLKKLEDFCPELIPFYERLYSFKHNPSYYNGNYTVNDSYYHKYNEIFLKLCDRYKIPFRIKRFIPEDFRKINYMIAEKLLNISYMKQLSGSYWQDYFWMGQNIQNLKESIMEVATKNELGSIRGMNSKMKKKLEDELTAITNK